MAQFPLLKTGAVNQYPGLSLLAVPVQVVQFLDNSSQRWLAQGTGLRRWQVRLDLLDEDEVHAIEQFFEQVQGQYGVFSFVDPATGSVATNCRFGSPELTTQYVDVDHATTSLWVVETNE